MIWKIEQLLSLFTLAISRVGSHPAVYNSRVGMALVRFFYNLVCKLCTGSKVDVSAISEHSFKGENGRIRLRIYRGAAQEVLPAVIFYHGGAFCVGDLDSHDSALRALARAASCAVIVPEYRLAPEHQFPAAANDAYATLEWVAINARDLGLDPNRLIVAGDSAGGTLATVVARWARQRGGPDIALQILLYPMTDASMSTASWHEFAEGPALNRDMISAAWSRYCPDVQQRLSADVSPLYANDLRGLPPAIVLTADNDPLRDEGEAYAISLKSQGVEVSLKRFAGSVHGFFQIADSLHGRQATADIVASIVASDSPGRSSSQPQPDRTILCEQRSVETLVVTYT